MDSTHRGRPAGEVAALSVAKAAAPRSTAPGLALAGVGAAAFSAKAIIVKLAYRYDVDAVTLIMYRMLFALPFFVAMAWWAGRGRARLTPRELRGVVGLGFCGYYLASFLDFAGLAYISASLERLILYLGPTLVMLLGWWLHGRRPRPLQWVAMAVSYAGVVLVFGTEAGAQGPQAAWGMLLVLLSALSYAVYMVFSGEMVRRLGSLRLVGWATSFACLFCLLQFVLLRPLAAAWVAPEVVWLSLANAVFCTSVPVLLVMMAIERIGADMAAQMGLLGPLSTIALGVWLLGEPVTIGLVAGSALVLTGIYLFTRWAHGPRIGHA